MKRWIALTLCALTTAACQDRSGTEGLTGPAESGASILGLPGVRLDPALTTALNLASPLQKLEVIVNFDEAQTSGSVLGNAILGTGAGIITFKHLPVVAALATPAQIASIRGLPGVTSLYANRQLRYMLREAVQSVKADQVHATGYTGKGVGIAILDSGVDGQYHPGLAYGTKTVQNVKVAADMRELVTFDASTPAVGANLWVENVPNSETSIGHGTHVAGIAAGSGAGSTDGIYKGVAPGSHVVGIGAGDVLFVLWTLAGFDYILENRDKYNIQVVNNSWGITGAYDAEDPVNRATRKLYDAGIAVVFAAGNEGPAENTLNPYSAAPWVLSVAAGCKLYVADPTNSVSLCEDASNAGRAPVLAYFSSRGIPGDPLVHPDITAPGANVVSARASMGLVMNAADLLSDATECQVSLQHFDHYTCASGTSMAAPVVTGIIALMEEASRGRLTPEQAYRALTRTARPLAGYAEWEQGAGYVDAAAAVKAVRR
ncbi:MAG TPA: S8 family serine peptidase [Longimicrobiaceae bacterium]|nr:S8 family serine peptidase [Longimicrobiaceae bacterium]